MIKKVQNEAIIEPFDVIRSNLKHNLAGIL